MQATRLIGALAAAGALSLFAPARGQVISATGSYDNFDVFDDTGERAEGFEIDIEDIKPGDVTRIFPDNFPAGQPYIRYATPDKTKLALTTFPDGHRGVAIIYAAQYVNGAWVTQWGASTMPGTTTPIGNGTPYVANPTYTSGDSCWTLGLGTRYPNSGCDHFGVSLAAGVAPGRVTYHWLVPDPAHPGSLVQAGSLASLPPSPVLTPNPPVPGKPPQVHVVAEAPEDYHLAFGQWSDAYWLRTYTSYSAKPADLDRLQKNFVPLKNAPGVTVVATWKLLQRPPAGQTGEKAEIEDNTVAGKNVQVVKRFEYYQYNGEYDPDTHEVICGGDNSCDFPVKGLNGLPEKGRFVGAHMNAYDVR